METRYTVALVGCGRIGYSLGLDAKREQPASHTMALRGNSRIQLVAGCDTDPDNRAVWTAAIPHATVYESSSELYKKHRTDIVTVAVPESAHETEAEAAIKSGARLVILEKPVAVNSGEAERIRSLSTQYGVPVMINHERRFADDYRCAKKYMEQIGSLQSIYASLSSSLVVYNPDEEATGAYSLIHDGTHLVDAVLYFLDDTDLPAPVLTGVYKDEKQNIRQLSAHYALPACPDITLTISGRSRYFGFEIQINGTEGRICIGNGYLKCYKRQESPLYTGFYSLLSDSSVVKPEKTRYFANMVQNAVDFLDGTAPLYSPLEVGIRDLAVLEGIKKALY